MTKKSMLFTTQLIFNVLGHKHENLELEQDGEKIILSLTVDKKEISFTLSGKTEIFNFRLVDDRKGTHKDWLLVAAIKVTPNSDGPVLAYTSDGRKLHVGTSYLGK